MFPAEGFHINVTKQYDLKMCSENKNRRLADLVGRGGLNISTRTKKPFSKKHGVTLLYNNILFSTEKVIGYFEVEVPAFSNNEMISVGLVTKEFSFNQSQIGWLTANWQQRRSSFSVGWHSDDSGLFVTSNQNLLKSNYELKGVVGCGVERVPYNDTEILVVFIHAMGKEYSGKKMVYLHFALRKVLCYQHGHYIRV
eukprot:UN32694